MAKKIQLQDASGNVLHPLTLGECVAMSNGENLDTLMSKSQMFTPTITQDKSMFKVGTGVDVDYSANVKDGAYESLVFKGKSLVNLSNLHKSFNDETLSGYYSDTSLCETSKLKLGTPYTLVFYTTVHGGDHDIYNTIELGVGNVLHGADAHPKTTTNHRGTLVKNGWSKVCVTFTDFLGYKYLSLRPIRCNAPESGKSIRFSIEGFILLEGDWSNKDLPFNDYFDGIGYAKMPILRNVGKNLCPPLIVGSTINNNNGQIITDDTTINRARTDYIKINPKKNYIISGINTTDKTLVGFYDENKNYLSRTSGTSHSRISLTPDTSVSSPVYTIPQNASYIILSYYGDNLSAFDKANAPIQIEETLGVNADNVTTHEDHKTNILRTSEEIVLREVGGVQDTYNPLTGEYVRRIGEVVINGDDSINYNFESNSNDVTSLIHVSIPNTNRYFGFINDQMIEKIVYASNITEEGIFDDWNGVFIRILNSKLDSPNLEGVKAYLRSNPITVQYELAEPVTTIVKPSTMTPFAYQNGHVILESGFEGQSLLPEIEYSVVTGRTGQVTQNTKVLRQQEQQIIGLEELLLTQVVQMEYERTLLQFDYELQMMMLG